MKTKVKSTPIIASEGMENSVMGMDNHGRDMATYFLRDKIYSNKIEAVVREYICNAIDEHSKHDVDRPVEANLTSQGLSGGIFSVRDFAKGLSEDGVRKIFGMYFKSTKSETNDSIGGFGVGSKAGHAYTDAFNIISYYDGVKTSYSCVLGAGDNGVPVGHIYKMGESPTDETGVEINLEVKRAEERKTYSSHRITDVEKFKHEILSFVQYAHSPITAKIFDEVYNTPKQRHTAIIDGFTISIVDKFTIEETRSYDGYKFKKDIVQHGYQTKFKMGDVTYGEVRIPDGSNFQEHTMVTITAPMGSMDIPISREGMESTEKNNRLQERAVKAIKTLAEQDIESFKKKTLIELTDLYINNVIEESETGKYFKYRGDFIYSDYYKTVTSIRDTTHASLKTSVKNIDKENGKPVLVVIPNNRATEKWISKVNGWCALNGKKYLCVKEGCYNPDIKDTFSLMNARKLKFVSKQDKSRAVIYRDGCNWETMSALEFHNNRRKSHNLSEAKDNAQAKRQNTQLAKTEKNERVLSDFMLNPDKTTNSYYNGTPYHVASQALLKDLREIGIKHKGLDNPISVRKEKLNQEKIDKASYESYAYCIEQVVWLSDRTRRIVKENNAKSQKIVDFIERISLEDSLRGRILKEFVTLRHFYGKQAKLSKADMKRILKLV